MRSRARHAAVRQSMPEYRKKQVRKTQLEAPPSLELHSVAKLHRHAAAELVLNMRADDRVKTVFRLEAQFLGAARDEFLRPAADDPLDQFVRFPADQRDGLVAGNAAQRLDLLGNGHGH